MNADKDAASERKNFRFGGSARGPMELEAINLIRAISQSNGIRRFDSLRIWSAILVLWWLHDVDYRIVTPPQIYNHNIYDMTITIIMKSKYFLYLSDAYARTRINIWAIACVVWEYQYSLKEYLVPYIPQSEAAERAIPIRKWQQGISCRYCGLTNH